jgi:hypothetical protein
MLNILLISFMDRILTRPASFPIQAFLYKSFLSIMFFFKFQAVNTSTLPVCTNISQWHTLVHVPPQRQPQQDLQPPQPEVPPETTWEVLPQGHKAP